MRKSRGKLARAAALLGATACGVGAYVYLTLPDVRPLATAEPTTTAFMELRAREARAKGREPRRVHRWIGYRRMSPHLIGAVLVAEDARFWRHEGVDFEQIRESIEVNIERREFARGGSTITQQLAKNLYLSPAKTPVRKLRELLIARRLEAALTKQRILELYLNVIEWGDGIFGAEAAARSYFGKSAAELAPQEAALLAAAIVNPRLLNPARPSARLLRRQQMILRRMGAAVPTASSAGSPASVDGAGVSAPMPRPDTPAELPATASTPAPPVPVEGCGTPPCR